MPLKEKLDEEILVAFVVVDANERTEVDVGDGRTGELLNWFKLRFVEEDVESLGLQFFLL